MTASRFASVARGAGARLILLVTIVGAGVGCSRVAPYQRGRLAHPTMLVGDLARPAQAHVYSIREGAIGGSNSVQGGCGCN